jgi:nitroimidazol reductase NimA-like FMN-containing flavoprotein (pyridoxamine 5'-phosphate oxidase superfamily)
MRLKDRAITDTAVIDLLLAKATTCRLGMCADNVPYVVPMNFAHEGNTVFFTLRQKRQTLRYVEAKP